jgi:hypothetical protein
MAITLRKVKLSDKKLTNFLESTKKELEKFFGIKIKPAKLFLLNSRKQINQLRHERTEPWVVGWIKNNTIYILSPDVFTKESNHKDVNEFWRVLKHEYSHTAIEQFCKCRPRGPAWLIEGLSCYLAEQEKRKPTGRELLAIFKKKLKSREIYVVGYFWVKFLIKRFGKEKFIKLLKHIANKPDEKDFGRALYGIYKFHYSKEDFNKLL